MESIASWSVAAAMLLMAAFQSAYVVYYCLALRPAKSGKRSQNLLKTTPQPGVTGENLPAPYQPEVAVIVCLRGPDPSLVDCLDGLANQEYPNFQIHIVVDHPSDPALDLVKDFYEHRQAPTIHTLASPRSTCSLKCSAILEAESNLSDDIEVMALIDADTVPDQNWLSDLIQPLAASRIGATTGNRWFAPDRPGLGSYVRQIWNAAAIVQMQIYNIAWGGTLAVKRTCFRECGLAEKWGHAFCEDTLLTQALHDNGYQVFRVPNLVLENTESTSLRAAAGWITRQLLTVRLYHRKWNWVMAHGILASVPIVVGPAVLIADYFLGSNPASCLFLMAVILFYQVWNLVLFFLVNSTTSGILGARESYNRQSDLSVGWSVLLPAIIATQLIHPICCCRANWLTQASWRGVRYSIEKKSIQIENYHPFADNLPTESSLQSDCSIE